MIVRRRLREHFAGLQVAAAELRELAANEVPKRDALERERVTRHGHHRAPGTRSLMHVAEQLWQRHAAVAPYPDGVLPVPEPIPGTAFFPGGYGLWRPDARAPLPPFPVGGVMVLGHDFHSEDGYRASLERGRESEGQPTWSNLLRLLRQVEIPPQECFFTNVYMGIRAGRQTTGVFPGARDAPFVARCRHFLAEQLAAQRPRLVLTLGVYAPRVLAPLSRELADWHSTVGFKALDRLGPVRHGVRFRDAAGVEPTVVALTHPCLRHAAVRHRTYKGLTGHAAELAMLEDAKQKSAWEEVRDKIWTVLRRDC